MPTKLLVYDIETDGLEADTCNLKFFGAYSYSDKKYYLYDYNEKKAIKELVESHTHRIGFNNKSFDEPILKRFLNYANEVEEYEFDKAVILDLYQVSAPRMPNHEVYSYNADRLKKMGIRVNNYKLNTIIEALGLSETSKGEIDYNIFTKNSWTAEERAEIETYLKQDVELTKLLYQWYWDQFKPLMELLPEDAVWKLKHISWGIPSLAYRIICHKMGLMYETNEEKPEDVKSFAGGHHIYNGVKNHITKGNIVEIDFSSAYPHSIMMTNACSPKEGGWHGDGYYTVAGSYDTEKLGIMESTLKEIYLKRMEAKNAGDTIKSQAYKIIINSAYGLLGAWRYKHLYNPISAADCTSVVRTWLRKLAYHLELEGFEVLYGFTDSIFVSLPEGYTHDDLQGVMDYFLEEAKDHVPFPMDTFKLDVEEEFNMFWVLKRNCYLGVTKTGDVVYKSTLLNKNTPKAVINIFENYIKPKIIQELKVSFSKEELLNKLTETFSDNIEMSSVKYTVKPFEQYKCKTAIQAQISERYGAGTYYFIPNLSGIGVGLSKGTKKRKGTRYCTVDEFVSNGLTIEDIDLSKYSKKLLQFVIENKQLAEQEMIQ